MLFGFGKVIRIQNFFTPKQTSGEESSITRIKDFAGMRQEHERCNQVILEHFSKLFSNHGTFQNVVFLKLLNSKALSEIISDLGRPDTKEEVKITIWQMHQLKTPRPNGMAPFFFQKFWPQLRKQVTNTVLLTLNTGEFLDNHTHVVLIPKKKSLERVGDLQTHLKSHLKQIKTMNAEIDFPISKCFYFLMAHYQQCSSGSQTNALPEQQMIG